MTETETFENLCSAGYNTTHHNPKQYFANLADVDIAELQRCNDTAMANPRRMGLYAFFSGDYDGMAQIDTRTNRYKSRTKPKGSLKDAAETFAKEWCDLN